MTTQRLGRLRPGFTEDWFGSASQKVLARLVKTVEDVPGLIVEVGSWEGRSTVALANAAYPRVVHAVDTWAGSPGEVSGELGAIRDVFRQWECNVAAFTRGNVVPFRMGWRDYPLLEPIALAFIDAEHTYTEVKENVERFVPWMSPGGIICGDDAHHPPIIQAVDQIFGLGDVEFDATLWVRGMP